MFRSKPLSRLSVRPDRLNEQTGEFMAFRGENVRSAAGGAGTGAG